MGKAELRIEIDARLLEQAEAAHIAVETLVEGALKTALGEAAAEERARQWADENAEAIRDHNERIARRGVFGADLRRW